MSYLGTKPSNQTPTYKQVYEYTATAGQTTFTASYTVGFVEVIRNGVKLGSPDFTATNGTSIVLTNGCTAGDFVRIESVFTANVQGAIPNTANAVVDSNINSMTASKLSGAIPYANQPVGSILQIVNATVSTGITTISTTPVDLGLSASITPKFATSKILVCVNINGLNTNASGTTGGAVSVAYNGSTLFIMDSYIGYTTLSDTDHYLGGIASEYLHSPATTSSITYKVQAYKLTGLGNFRIMPAGSALSSITLLEIAQ